MILLNSILKEAGVYPTKELTAVDIKKLDKILRSRCRVAYELLLKNDLNIWRGVRRDDEWFYYNQAHTERHAANTSNYYNLILSNHSVWKAYPKRNLSTIGSTNMGTSTQFGYAYCCLPVGDPIIGICPKPDLWDSFKKWDSLEEFNVLIGSIYNEVYDKNISKSITYDELYKSFDFSDKSLRDVAMGVLYRNAFSIGSDFESYMFNNDSYNFIDFVTNAYLYPDKNNFKFSKLSQLDIRLFNDDREVWWSGPTIFVFDQLRTYLTNTFK